MNGMAEHARPGKRHDHLWVVGVIGTACGIEVLGSWFGLGSVSGFPRVLGAPTGWTLAICIEAYAGYALWVWLAGAPGTASRRFAMWSALASFALSLAGQVGYHQMLAAGRTVVPQWLVGFAAALPVIVLILGAILVHLMHHDRRKAEELAEAQEAAERQAAAERAEADERAYLRRELDAVTGRHEAAVSELRAELEAANEARTEAENRAAAAEAKAAKFARNPGANSGPNRARKAAPNSGARGSRKDAESGVPDDVDARAEALLILANEPGISGAQLGERCGKSERWGQLLKKQLAGSVSGPEAAND